jgi:hypothetical protein
VNMVGRWVYIIHRGGGGGGGGSGFIQYSKVYSIQNIRFFMHITITKLFWKVILKHFCLKVKSQIPTQRVQKFDVSRLK